MSPDEMRPRMRTGLIPDYPLQVADDGTVTQQHAPSDWLFHDSALAAGRPVTGATIGTSINWLERVGIDKVQNQLGGTCVGQSVSSSLVMRSRIQGKPIARPSPTLIVAVAQMTDYPGEPIDCDGCRMSVAVRGIRDRGVVAEDVWPETAENLETIPPEDVWARAEGATVDAYYRIPDGGDVAAGLIAALERGYLPIFGMAVDERYEEIGGGIYTEPGGKPLGNHAQLVVGYSAVMNAFLILNSWSERFGINGCAWIAAEFMARRTFDRLVIQSTPVEV